MTYTLQRKRLTIQVNHRINILGTVFDNLTFDEAVEAALELTHSGGYCVTPNPEIVMTARGDSEFSSVINGANLVVADGIGVVYASKILGTPLKVKIPGIELAEAVLAKSMSVFLFGAKPGVAELAGEKLKDKYPGLCIVGTQNGYDYDNDSVMAAIAEANAALTFVCLGARKQELFMADFRAKYPYCKTLLIGLGGALDAFSGTFERAPESWRKLNLEWLYRLIKQPSRIKRMIKLPAILILAVGKRISNANCF